MGIGDLLRQSTHHDGDPFDLGSTINPNDTDPLSKLRLKAQRSLYDRLGSRVFDPNLSAEQLRSYVIQELDSILSSEVQQLSVDDRHELVETISHDLLGLGPLEPLLKDQAVTEIMVNGNDSIYVEMAGRLYLSDSRFSTQEHLRQVIERIVSSVGRRIDESSPMVDARLADGSRVNAVIPPLAVDGPQLTIRKFAHNSITARDLISFGTLTDQSVELLEICVKGKRNILISGGTGSGKTTLLNMVSSFIPDNERIVTIEDAVELQLNQRHVVRLEARPPNVEGKGEVRIRDLVKNALRMRPDRIVVGEVRGGEALDMLQAMNTGHEGSLSTLHANSPRDAVSRLETMVMMSELQLPMKVIREQVKSAIDMIVHLSRMRDGTRRVTHISEIVTGQGDSETVNMSPLFEFKHQGFDPDGKVLGFLEPTGIRPDFANELAAHGLSIDQTLGQGAPDPFNITGYR